MRDWCIIKKKCLIILAKLLKNILQLLTGLELDICHVIKGYDSKLQKWQNFKTILAPINLLFKIVINLKILESSQEYFYSEVVCS